MKPPKPIELAFYHPYSSTFAQVVLRPIGFGVPTVRVNVSIRNERGIDSWGVDRCVSTWHKWVERQWKTRENPYELPALPPGWIQCHPEDLPN